MYSEQKQALAAELSFKHPAVLAVSGSAGSGKTALLAALLPVLKSRGLKVGVIREADDLRLPAETIVGEVPGADFALDDPAALADWIENQMPSL